MADDKETQVKAADELLQNGTKFYIRIFGIKVPLKIKPLKLRTVIAISKEDAAMIDFDNEKEGITEMLKCTANLTYLARIVALSVLNSKWKIRLFGRFLANQLSWKIEQKEQLFYIMKLIRQQVSPEEFFFTMALTRGLNILQRKSDADTKEDEVSGEQ